MEEQSIPTNRHRAARLMDRIISDDYTRWAEQMPGI